MLLSEVKKHPRLTRVRQLQYAVAETTCDVCGEFHYDEDIIPITGAHDYDLCACPVCLPDIKIDVPPPDGCIHCGNPVTMDDQIDNGVFMCRECERKMYA